MAAVALLLLSEAALCSSWSYIGTSEQNASFIESTTISDEGQDTKGFWVAMVTADKALPFDTVVSYMQVKCPSGNLGLCKATFTYEESVSGAMGPLPLGSVSSQTPWGKATSCSFAKNTIQ